MPHANGQLVYYPHFEQIKEVTNEFGSHCIDYQTFQLFDVSTSFIPDSST